MIRPAVLADLETIHRLEVECFEEPWNRRMIEGELLGHARICLVATEDERIVGYLLVMQILDELHVNKIGVGTEWRRRGVARELMRTLDAIAAARDCALITLEVREPNRAAREFYESLGFESEYVRRRYYANGDDAIIMSRGLRRE